MAVTDASGKRLTAEDLEKIRLKQPQAPLTDQIAAGILSPLHAVQDIVSLGTAPQIYGGARALARKAGNALGLVDEPRPLGDVYREGRQQLIQDRDKAYSLNPLGRDIAQQTYDGLPLPPIVQAAEPIIRSVAASPADLTRGEWRQALEDAGQGATTGLLAQAAGKMPHAVAKAGSKLKTAPVEAPPPPVTPTPAPPAAAPPKPKFKLGTRMATPEELMAAESWGEPLSLKHSQIKDPVRMESARQLLSDPAKARILEGLRPPIVTVSPGGKMDVVDGRHRILAARELNKPLKVKFERGSKAMDKVKSVQEAPPPPPLPPAINPAQAKDFAKGSPTADEVFYHNTTPENAKGIRDEGFRPSDSNAWWGGGVYLSPNKPLNQYGPEAVQAAVRGNKVARVKDKAELDALMKQLGQEPGETPAAVLRRNGYDALRLPIRGNPKYGDEEMVVLNPDNVRAVSADTIQERTLPPPPEVKTIHDPLMDAKMYKNFPGRKIGGGSDGLSPSMLADLPKPVTQSVQPSQVQAESLPPPPDLDFNTGSLSANTTRPKGLSAVRPEGTTAPPEVKETWEEAAARHLKAAREQDKYVRDVKAGLAPADPNRDLGLYVPDMESMPPRPDTLTDPTNKGFRRNYSGSAPKVPPPLPVKVTQEPLISDTRTPEQAARDYEQMLEYIQRGNDKVRARIEGLPMPPEITPAQTLPGPYRPTAVERRLEEVLGPNWREFVDEVARR